MEEQYGLEIWRLLHQLMRNHKKSNTIPNLTELETRVLFTANYHKKHNHVGINVRELKNKLNVSSPTISQVVNDLEKRDIVKRVKDSSDGRITRIEVSKSGQKELDRAVKVVESQFVALGDYLGEEKSRLLITILNDINTFFTKEDLQ